MKKRLLSLLLALVMLVGMIPATSLTAFAAATTYNYVVCVGGVSMHDGDYLAVGATATQTTKPSGGYAYYNDGTLTLNNYSYEGKGYQYISGGGRYATVYADLDLTLELVGTNTLTQTEDNSNVIYAFASDLTVGGNGKLIGTSDSYGLKANGDLTINGGTIAVTTNYESIIGFENVSINGGDIIAESKLQNYPCIYAGYDITINCANVTAISAHWAIAYGRSITIAKDLNIRASTTADGELGEYFAANHDTYRKIVITLKSGVVYNVNVSATFSGTPAKATTSTKGATVTATTWYKKSGTDWVQVSASDTIKEGNTYRCEVTVGATGDYGLADGYTVKINGTAATKKSGNTWYRDVTITGYTSYVDVYDIALPEAGAHPDFTFNDEDCYHSSVALVEWFECDKDGKKLSGALPADYKFKEDSYYRLEVTAIPDANYKFDTRNLGFYIGMKAVQYYYPYQDTTYPDSVTGWKVYHVDDANGTYTVQIGDITLKDGDYLANNATSVTTVKPVGGYAYYKDGVLTLNNFVAAKLVRYYERYLEVELIGENKIGAIADYYYWGGNASNNYYTGLEFRGDGNLEFSYCYDTYSNISVNGDVFFNGNGNIILDAEIHCFQFTDNVIINDGYVSCYCAQSNVFSGNANITVNGGKLQMTDGGSWYGSFISEDAPIIYAGNVYVSADPHKIELADCVPWDGVTNLNTYDCVWIVPKPEIYVGGVGMYNGDYLANGATTTQTTKPSGGYAYYKDGKLTLNNYIYTGYGFDHESNKSAIIYTSNDIQIELVGTNTLTQKDYLNTACIWGEANVSLTGAGILNLKRATWGIISAYDISIEGGNLNVDACTLGIYSQKQKVIINGGSLKIDATECAVNGSKGIEINGGSGIFRNTQDSVYRVLHSRNGTVTIDPSLVVMASTTADGEPGEYVAANLASYKKIVIKTPGVYVGGVGMGDGNYLAVGATTTQTTKPSGGYAYYKNGTLTLNNYSYEGKGYQYDSIGSYATVYANQDLTVKLVGTNSLVQEDYYSEAIRIELEGITFDGTGSLCATAGYAGICVDGTLTVNGGTIVSTGGFGGMISYNQDIVINDGNVTVSGSETYGLRAEKGVVEINGGTVTVTGIEQAIKYSTGFTVAEGIKIQASTTVDGELGEYVAENHGSYEKIVITPPDVYVGGVGMCDGDYLAVGATATQTTKPSGGYAYYKDGKLTLNNYSYEGEGYQYNGIGYYAIVYAKQDLTLELVGTNSLKQTASNSDGIYVAGEASKDKLTIQGDGSLNVTSTFSGIIARGSITVNGGTIISTAISYGIYSYNQDIIINDGNVTVSGSETYGLRAAYGVVEINGGYVTAIGGDKAINCGSSGSFSVAEGMKIQASTTVDGTLGEYVSANHDSYKKIVIKPAASTGLKGDVNLDGVVDMDDVVALMRHVLMDAIITDPTSLSNGEVTNDTTLDMDDVVKLMRYVLMDISTLD